MRTRRRRKEKKMFRGALLQAVLLGVSGVFILTYLISLFGDSDNKLFQYANVERDKDLKWDKCLAEQAELRAKDIYDKGFANKEFDYHEGYQDYIEKCGNWEKMGENISSVKNNLELEDSQYKAHYGLMESPTHKKNIIDPEFEKLGVGCYEEGERKICIQFFTN